MYSSMHLSVLIVFFFFSSRRRHTRFKCDWSSDVCSSDLDEAQGGGEGLRRNPPGSRRHPRPLRRDPRRRTDRLRHGAAMGGIAMMRLTILVSTGSIGRQTLEVVDALGGEIEVVAPGARRDAAALVAQARRYRPKAVGVADETAAPPGRAGVPQGP